MEIKTVFRNKENNQNSNENPIILRQSIYIFIFKIVVVELLSDLIYSVIRIPELYFNISPQLKIELIPYYFLIFLLLGVLRVVIILYIALYWINTQYVVTKGEIIFKTGVINVKEKIYSIAHIQEVIYTENFIGRLFNFGTLEIYSPSIRENMFFYQIPDPKKYQEIINSYLIKSESVSYTPEK